MTDDWVINPPQHKFTIGSSDYSDYVLSWPALQKSQSGLRLDTMFVELAESKDLLAYLNQPNQLPLSCAMGYVHNSQYKTIMRGSVDSILFNHSQQRLRLKVSNPISKLLQVTLGSSGSVLDLSSSSITPADLTWKLLTEKAGFDSRTDSSNTDIDYSSWLAWRNYNLAMSSTCRAYFSGESIYEVIDSLLSIEDVNGSFQDKMRFTLLNNDFETVANQINYAELINLGYEVSLDHVYNLFTINHLQPGFDIPPYPHKTTFSNSESMLSYGIRPKNYSLKGFWYENLSIPIAAQTQSYTQPSTRYRISLPMHIGIDMSIGETLSIAKNSNYIHPHALRILENKTEPKVGLTSLVLERAQRKAWQVIGKNAGNYVIKPGSLTEIDSGHYLAIADFGHYLLRSEGLEKPFAKDKSNLNPDQILFMGNGTVVAMSGRGSLEASVSTDNGKSFTPAKVPPYKYGYTIKHLAQVSSNTCIADYSWGNVLISNDQGKNWKTHQALGYEYGFTHFIKPDAQRLWGWASKLDASQTLIMESIDEGQNWQTKFTLPGDNKGHVTDCFRVNSGYIFAFDGEQNRGMYRLTYDIDQHTVPQSLSVTKVTAQSVLFTSMVDVSSTLWSCSRYGKLKNADIYQSKNDGQSWSLFDYAPDHEMELVDAQSNQVLGLAGHSGLDSAYSYWTKWRDRYLSLPS